MITYLKLLLIYQVLKTGGELVVWRRPTVNDIVSYKNYIPCKFCLSFLLQSDMWKHVKSCPLKHTEAKEKDLVIEAKCLLYPNRFSGGASKELQVMILQSMYKDLISKVAQGDHLITTYGSFLLNTSGIKRANEISQRMRILARLLIKVRELKSNESLTLSSLIDPPMFESIIACTQDLGGFSFETVDGENLSAFKHPSLPLKIGYSLEKCSQLLKGLGIKNGDNSLKTRATDFSDVSTPLCFNAFLRSYLQLVTVIVRLVTGQAVDQNLKKIKFCESLPLRYIKISF